MPRTADFLFSKNRLNVAISRARCLAYLVCTDELLDTRARDVDEMALISALGRIEQGRTQVIVAPTMHGTMHNAQLVRNAQRLAAQGVRFVQPRDAYGKHNLPDTETLCIAVGRALSTSPLRGRAIK